MASIAFLQLTATHPDYPRSRYYEVEVMKDLIGDWVLATYFGDTGNPGRYRQYGFHSLEELLNKLSQILRRRFNAQSNQGYRYCVVSFYTQEDHKMIERVVKNAYEQEAGGHQTLSLSKARKKIFHKKSLSNEHFPLLTHQHRRELLKK